MRTLAVTRPTGEGDDTAHFIRQLGWNPLIVHTVELSPREPSEIFSDLRTALSEGSLDWLVFMSPRGVHLLLEALRSHGNLLRSVLGQFRIVAVGPRTREALLKDGIHDVLMPEAYSSEGVAVFLSRFPLHHTRVVLARSSDANDSLAGTLTSKGAIVKTVHLYSSSAPENRASIHTFVGELKLARVSAVLFTSSVSASNLFRITEHEMSADELAGLLGKTLVGAIGPVTALKLRELGVQPDIVPARHLIDEAARLLVEVSEARKPSTPTSSIS